MVLGRLNELAAAKATRVVAITDERRDRLEPSEPRSAMSSRRDCAVRAFAANGPTVSTQCVEEHGVTLGGNTLGGDGARRPKVKQAVQQQLDDSMTSSDDGPAICAKAAVTTQGGVGDSLGGDDTLGGDNRFGGCSADWMTDECAGQRQCNYSATSSDTGPVTHMPTFQSPPNVTRWVAAWASAWVATGWVATRREAAAQVDRRSAERTCDGSTEVRMDTTTIQQHTQSPPKVTRVAAKASAWVATAQRPGTRCTCGLSPLMRDPCGLR